MSIFKKKKGTAGSTADFTRIYQYADSAFLPDTSQPSIAANYEITADKYTPHTSTRYINLTADKTKKALPELYKLREECCGCTACCTLCPADAIVMRPCEEGFLYPVVDAEKCVRCYRCIGVCPIKAERD